MDLNIIPSYRVRESWLFHYPPVKLSEEFLVRRDVEMERHRRTFRQRGIGSDKDPFRWLAFIRKSAQRKGTSSRYLMARQSGKRTSLFLLQGVVHQSAFPSLSKKYLSTEVF